MWLTNPYKTEEVMDPTIIVAGGVLLHLEGAGRDAAGVGGLAGAEEHPGLREDPHAVGRRGHVGALGDGEAAVLHQRPRRRGSSSSFCGRARQGDVAGHVPDGPARRRTTRPARRRRSR